MKIAALTTQLYSIPPWAAAFVFSQVVAYFSDRLRHRFLFVIIPICISLAGLAMLLNIHNKRHVEYGALFLVTSGTYSAMPVIVCWFAMNLGGHTRRSVGTAWQVGFGNSTFLTLISFFFSKLKDLWDLTNISQLVALLLHIRSLPKMRLTIETDSSFAFHSPVFQLQLVSCICWAYGAQITSDRISKKPLFRTRLTTR